MSNLVTKNEFSDPTNEYLLKSQRYMQYRDKLLKAGFTETEWYIGRFFLQATEKTAFVINLEDAEYGVSVLYGFAAISQMADDDKWYSRNGWDNDTCHVRNTLFLCDEKSELYAAERISEFYNLYKNYSKEEILALKKERQKSFLNRFAPALKSLGFKRKGPKWTKELYNGTALTFEAQKSAFSDQYYFNVIVHDSSDCYAYKSNERVVINHQEIYNWQLMTEEQINYLIQYTLTNYIIPKISN